MTNWTNTAEGTSTSNVATSDTGSGNAWNAVSVVAGQTITYDNTVAAHGVTSHKHANTTGGGAYVAWTSTTLGAISTAYARVYFYFTTVPTVTTRLVGFLSSTTVRAAFRTDSTGHLVVANGAGTTMLTSTTVLTTGTWYRGEVKVIGSATTGGQAQLKLYNLDSTTALEDITSASTFDTGGTIDTLRFGNGTGAQNVTVWMDDYAASDVTWVGPSVLTTQTTRPSADVTTSGWTNTGGSGSAFSTLNETTPSDTEFVSSPNNPTSSVLEVKVADFVIPTTKTGWTVDYRIKATSATSSTVVVGFYQGATLIATETRSSVPSTFTTYTMVLTSTQAANVTDGTDCRIRWTATAS